MAAERGALPRPGLAAFAGLSWSAWLERDGPTRDGGSGSEPEEGGKSSPRRADTVTLIKEDMDIFGHCPAHDDFYLVVCNQCCRVVKPQAFQKHCERRHSPPTPPCSRPPPRPLPVPGAAPGPARAPPGARGRSQTLPERPDRDNNNNNNLCLFVPVVNLEKIPGIPKPDGHGFKEPPKGDSRESPGPRERPVPGGVGGDSALPGDKDLGVPKAPPRSHRKPPRKECDLNRQCGVRNPHSDTPCTRLLTCKIHSVQQRRDVPGRAKDFDVLLAELRGARRGDPPHARDGGPPRKDPQPHLAPHAPQGLPTALPQPPSAPQGTPLCPQPPPARARLCSDSDPEDAPAAPGEGGTGGAPPGKGGGLGGSEDSEDEGGAQEPPRTPRPPRPQAFCAFGSRLLSPGCYVFHRRLDRVCSALREMLRRHRRARAWRKIPPASDPPLHPPATPPSSAAPTPPTPIYVPAAPSPPPPRPLPAPGGSRGVPPNLTYAVGSPPAAAACSPPEGGGGCSQSVTSPLPAHTPSPSSSKLPPPKAPRPPREPPRPWQTPPRAGSPPYKRACLGEGFGGRDSGGGPPIAHLKGAPRVRPLPPPAPPQSGGRDPLAGPGGPPRGLSEDEEKKRRNSATYCRPHKAKAAPPTPAGPPAPAPPHPETPGPGGGSERRRKAGTPPGFQEEGRALKSKAH